jgi:hypothetical protein
MCCPRRNWICSSSPPDGWQSLAGSERACNCRRQVILATIRARKAGPRGCECNGDLLPTIFLHVSTNACQAIGGRPRSDASSKKRRRNRRKSFSMRPLICRWCSSRCSLYSTSRIASRRRSERECRPPPHRPPLPFWPRPGSQSKAGCKPGHFPRCQTVCIAGV